ncbi:glycosyltransferase [Cellulomonas endophytica]|uniref:glycosyltransferase n=1 Tax=Cellulomonas endophytica TaxID=2494735 RepID=UPI001F0C8758|nr:glycosyltransferase [Cellulomonas endophytica]
MLPLRWHDDAALAGLTDHLARLTRWLDVTVVDGSPPDRHAAHAAAWAPLVAGAGLRHLVPEPWPGGNGKVAGVMTGVRHARHDRVVVGDDDVRHDRATLARVVDLLGTADAVRPQNVLDPLPWHVWWDTGRTLLNRGLGHDFPGTLGVRRGTLLAAGGYRGDVLFENLELLRTVRAAGGTVVDADDVLVVRRPPTARHFLGQRRRQAYDSLAQPGRLAAELAVLPSLVAASRLPGRRRPAALGGALAAVLLVAERGRRRAGGRAAFPVRTTLAAPLWLLERAVLVWTVPLARLRGGVPYAGGRLVHAATPLRRLRAAVPRVARAATRTGPEQRLSPPDPGGGGPGAGRDDRGEDRDESCARGRATAPGAPAGRP